MNEAFLAAAVMHAELAALWAKRHIAFLWSAEAEGPLWANRAALRSWGQRSLGALSQNRAGNDTAERERISDITHRLPVAVERFERFRICAYGREIIATFRCRWIELGETRAVLFEGEGIPDIPEQEGNSGDLRKEALFLLGDAPFLPFIALSSEGSLLFSTDTALRLLSKVPRESARAPAPYAEALRHVVSNVQANVAMPLVGEPSLHKGLSTEAQRIPLDTQGRFLTLLKLCETEEQKQTVRHTASSVPFIGYVPASIAEGVGNPVARNDHIRSRDEEGNSVAGQEQPTRDQRWAHVQNENHSLLDRKEAPTDEGNDEEAEQETGTGKNMNIFPFTGVPSRIHDGPARTPERRAFRAIAEALGARIEDDSGENTDLPCENGDHGKFLCHRDELLAILDRVPTGLLIYRDGDPLYANRAFLRAMGYDKLSDLPQTSSLAELLAEAIGDGKANIGDPLPLGEQSISETTEVRGITIRIQAVVWGGKRAILLALHRNTASLTEQSSAFSPMVSERMNLRHHMEEGARVADLTMALDIATDGFILVGDDGRVASVSEQAARLLSLQGEDVKGQALEDLFPASCRTVIQSCLDEAKGDVPSQGLRVKRLLRLQHERGEETLLRVRVGTIRKGKNPLRCVIFYRKAAKVDTDQTKLIEAIEARQNAERANERKSAFLANISHEIRTPLNAIIGFSEIMAKRGAVGSENECYRDYIRNIRLSGEYLLRLVNDLLDLSKIEAGKLELDITEVDINDVVRHSIDILRPEIMRKKIVLRQDLSRFSPRVLADCRTLSQAVLNLLSNAIKFNKPGGQILVSTSITESGETRLHIRDTGIGMTSRQLEIALEDFRQIHGVGNTKSPPEGTGLGLPLAKALAEANKACFSLESTPECGTLAKITFPKRGAKSV